jgi:hypothetical protein
MSRINDYEYNKRLYYDNHQSIFNFKILEYKVDQSDYISHDLLRVATDIKLDLLLLKKPLVTIEGNGQDKWQDIEKNSLIWQKIRKFAESFMVYGDSVAKIVRTDNNISLLNIDPSIWEAFYDDMNPDNQPLAHQFRYSKNVEGVILTLVECYKQEGIFYWVEDKHGTRYSIDPFWNDIKNKENLTVVENDESMWCQPIINANELIIFFCNNRKSSEFYGNSDFTQAIVSKLKALEKYTNLADFVLETNTIPPVVINKSMIKNYNKIKTQIQNYDTKSFNNISDFDLTGIDQATPNAVFGKQDIYTLLSYRQLLQEKVFVQGADEPEVKFLQNSFDLTQLYTREDKLFKQIMSELSISEVFYNPGLSTGAQSGVAYKRLMGMTLNAVENYQELLTPILETMIVKMLSLEEIVPLNVKIEFADGVITDEKERVELFVTKIQNQLTSNVQAIQALENKTEAEAQIEYSRIIGNRQQVQDTSNTPANRIARKVEANLQNITVTPPVNNS